MTALCDHEFVVLTPEDSEEPFGLHCSRCERTWPVGSALPEIYDWAVDVEEWRARQEATMDERLAAAPDFDPGESEEQGETP